MGRFIKLAFPPCALASNTLIELSNFEPKFRGPFHHLTQPNPPSTYTRFVWSSSPLPQTAFAAFLPREQKQKPTRSRTRDL
jgi:hypothetical protein